jgi:hypothetical protein
VYQEKSGNPDVVSAANGLIYFSFGELFNLSTPEGSFLNGFSSLRKSSRLATYCWR